MRACKQWTHRPQAASCDFRSLMVTNGHEHPCSRNKLGDRMMNMRDKAGRPIVAVTGSGLVTSLGAGKEDNWRRLTAGESGIRKITRFGTDTLKTKVAGTVDFIPVDPYSAPALSERLAEV